MIRAIRARRSSLLDHLPVQGGGSGRFPLAWHAVATHRWTRFVLGSFVVCAMIYLGFWTTPIRQIPQQAFDEPDWLYSSYCIKPLPGRQRRPECRPLNVQTIDFSPTTKYVLAMARKVTGIPADRVKYYYHIGEGPHEPLTPEIRAAIIRVIIGMSSLALVTLAFVLRCSYGIGPTLTALGLLLVTPYWRYALRGVMADPGIFFFSVLAWAGTCGLAYLLVRKPRFTLVLGAAAGVGAAVGCAMAARYNSVLLAVGFAAVLLYIGARAPGRWFLLLWAAIVAFLAAMAVVVALATPVSWPASPAEYLQIVFRFNAVIPFGYFQGNPLGPVDSLRTTVAGSFTMSYFNVLPPLVSVPLCLAGLWTVFHRAAFLGRVSGIWLLAIGIPQLFLNPVGMTPYVWDRYAMYFILAVYAFMGVGAWEVGTFFVRGAQRAGLPDGAGRADADAPAARPRRYHPAQKIIAALCLIAAILLGGSGGVALLQGSRETALWRSFILASTTDKRIAVLGEMVDHNPRARVIYNGVDSLSGGSPIEVLAAERAPADAQPLYVPDNVGEPVVAVLARYFEANVDTIDPATLGALMRAGPILLAHSDDADLRARIRYDLGRLDEALRLRLQGAAPADDFVSGTPASLIPTDWKENPREVLADPGHPIEATVLAPQAGGYRVVVLGLNPAGARIPVGVMIDKVPVGTIVFERGDNSWTADSVVATLGRGNHQVALRVLSGADERAGRVGAIRRVMLIPNGDSHVCRAAATVGDTAAILCATGAPAVVLDAARPRADVAVDAPVPALYDIALTVRKSDAGPRQITVAVDGLSLGGVATLASRDGSPYSTPPLPPLYLVPGAHSMTIARVGGAADAGTVTLDELSFLPRYPDPHVLTPPAFGSPGRGGAPMVGDASIAATTQWYGHNFGFYQVHLAGATDDAMGTTVEVYADDQLIGTTRLAHDGASAPPVVAELANGATHRIRLRPRNLPAGLSARVDAVEIKPYIGPSIFAGSGMSWAERDNDAVASDGSAIGVLADIPVARTVDAGESGIYRITARVRSVGHVDEPATLGIDIDGWHGGNQEIGMSGEWADVSFTAFLPKGSRTLAFRWAGGTGRDRLDFLYVTVQEQRTGGS